ncbi:MAG: hypothetical protein Fur0018_14930 [Anaerolineales bacterium]
MPTLTTSLQGKDLGHLRIIAERWGLTEWQAPDAYTGLQRLVPLMLDSTLVEEIIEALPAETRAALEDLLQNGGQMSWQVFSLRYGQIREMGAGRRDRERPDLQPVSPAERLWYHGLIARNFFDTPNGPQEMVYIPEDLAVHLPAPRQAAHIVLGRPATPAERAIVSPCNDAVLDDACTLLAARRMPLTAEETLPLVRVPLPALQALLRAAGLLDETGGVNPGETRLFLEASRSQALLQLWQAWLHSPQYNDLKLLPGLQSEGEWQNDPIQARQALLDFLADLPPDAWWSMSSFVHAVREHHPGYQRPGNDFDSWYLRDSASGEYRRGLAHWDAVDGALLREMIAGPLHFLGLLEIARPAEGAPPGAFRWSPWAADLLRGQPPAGLPAEDERLQARSDAHVYVPRLAPRAVRYQVARFCTWQGMKANLYVYQVTPAALSRAAEQQLQPQHLLQLLTRHASHVPPALHNAIQHWSQHGTQVRIQQATLLRVRTPDLLKHLQKSKAARFLGEPLGPTTVLLKTGAEEKVLEILAEMGYLGEIVSTSG